MNKHSLTKPLIAIGLLALVGTVGAETYYNHELARRVADENSGAPPAARSMPAPDPAQRDPWTAMHAEMMRMQAQMDRMFDTALQDFQGMPGFGSLHGGGEVTVKEEGDAYVVKAQIPDVKENDIRVNLDGRLFSISAATRGRAEQDREDGTVMQSENFASTFQRAFTLPGPVDAAGMHNQYQDGVLTVTIPKATS